MQKVLLVGYGYLGKKIFSAISNEMDVTIVDRDRNAIKEIVETDNIHPVHGDVINKEFISKIFKNQYDFVVSVTNSDKTNILLSTMAKKIGANYTIASIFQKDSVEQLTFLKESLGIDKMYNGAIEMASEVEKIVRDNLNYKSDVFGKGKIEVVGHAVEMDKNFANQKLKNIGELATLLVVGILRNSEIIVPSGETLIKQGDYLYIMGLTRDILNFKHSHFSIEKKTSKRLLLVGANESSLQICEVLHDYDITLIEEDSSKIKEYRNKLNNLYVHKAQFKGGEFFKDFKNYDSVLINTDSDELNIVLGLIAKKTNMQVLVKVSDFSYSGISDELSFTTFLNPMDIMANRIIKRLKSDRSISLYMAFGNKAEVLEFKLDENSKLIGKNLIDVKVPEGILVGGIIRKDGTAVIPRGKTIIENEDTLVLFCRKDSKEKIGEFIGIGSNKTLMQSIFR